jgi:hypothetical protein
VQLPIKVVALLLNHRNNTKTKIMIFTLTQGFKKVTFSWNDEMTECTYTALDVSDEEFDQLMKAKAHEGVDVDGWKCEMN